MTNKPAEPPVPPPLVTPDPWGDLRRHTSARLALGRAGSSMPTDELLRFGLAHAMARDAVHLPLDVAALRQQLADDGVTTLALRSAAVDRASYLLRPDLGRRLLAADALALQALALAPVDLLIVVGDGLSAMAVEHHARAMVAALRAQAPAGWQLGPVVVASQARVALADEIAELAHARMVVMLIGERPGLSSPDSLGLYLTWQPRRGRSDADRNCISNIRDAGLSCAEAARRCWWLATEARRLQLSGVALKDRSDQALLPTAAGPVLVGAAAPPAPPPSG